jgi:GMP synthase-like glutamine amidotransferase
MIRVAILDLYDGVPNQGMRCIRDILHSFAFEKSIHLVVDEFDVRLKLEVPDLTYDVYISSGGPGSPLATEGSKWESVYFSWLRNVEDWNDDEKTRIKKHVFFICHSFQLACRHYKVGNVCARKSTAFGVFPVHMLENASEEPVFNELLDPFYAVDSRDFQVIQPDHNRFRELGASILCIEKERPHIPLERAIMAIRFNRYFIGTQFHPEADAIGMSMYLQTEEKKKTVIDNYGEDKWRSMIEHLNDPEKILFTYHHILPNFLNLALSHKFYLSQKAVA